DKARELGNLLEPLGIRIKTLLNFPLAEQIEETGETLTENALLKARAGFRLSGLPTIADDTGLEVMALNGEPGVYSSRFAGENATYADNVRKLLEVMESVPDDRREGLFVTVAAYVDKAVEIVASGQVAGQITRHPRGAGGFGYDPVFLVDETQKTYAEMSLTEKNQMSHRARAFRNLLTQLQSQPLFKQLELPID
ncbi:MAG: RdgB/HAM1 family non-canonical purine NTP pyrophosphatase, partial [Candidatus Marinimicrobia bacterium]|nr:RdgB/HAM1 family non-canonical purine NTP pyrophosphatase [Candidatus Neomarinimicrobiota bacterium]